MTTALDRWNEHVRTLRLRRSKSPVTGTRDLVAGGSAAAPTLDLVTAERDRLAASLAEAQRRERELDGRLADATRYLFVPPGHYYSPIVNTDELKNPFAGNGPPQPVDVGMDLPAHVELWSGFATFFQRLPCLQASSWRYNDKNDNASFPLADAAVLQAMICRLKPKSYIEVGSGFSSAAMLDAVDALCPEPPRMTLIEPYPTLVYSLLRPEDRRRISVLEHGIQDTELDVFAQLGDGDILFIDSTHILKTGSDVHFELFEILPRLARGVYVHFHDIFWPFEYPPDWIFDVKRSWNELYALRAFLAGHREWEVVFFSDYFVRCAPASSRELLPIFFASRPGSLWLRKR